MNEKQITDLIERMRELGHIYSYQGAKNLIREYEKLNKPEKVKVPEFIEDWIFKCQLLNDFSLSDALNSKISNLYAKNGEVVMKWLKDKNNQETFALGWIYDYEAEKEPKYRVKLKNTNDYLNETETGFHFYNNYKNNKIFTQKELEYNDFGWVFDCPGIVTEEVE